MNGREFVGQALSLYHSYIEGGYPVSLQLWSAQDGRQHCKFSCLKRMEQGWQAQEFRDQVHEAGDQIQGAGDQVQGAGDKVQGAGDKVQGAGDKVQGAGDQVQGAGDQFQGAGAGAARLKQRAGHPAQGIRQKT